MLDVEVVLPVYGVLGGQDQDEVDEGEGDGASADHGLGLLVVNFVVEVGHLVGHLFGIPLVGSIKNEPFPQLKHGRQSVGVHLEGQSEVFLLQCC